MTVGRMSKLIGLEDIVERLAWIVLAVGEVGRTVTTRRMFSDGEVNI